MRADSGVWQASVQHFGWLWEVADIFRDHGAAWRHDRALSLMSLKAMSAIERCRSAELGGHVLRCDQCALVQIAYNSCRNRHCPKCQSSAAKRWLEDLQADLLPVEYCHLVFTLPASIGYIAYQVLAAGVVNFMASIVLPTSCGPSVAIIFLNPTQTRSKPEIFVSTIL